MKAGILTFHCTNNSGSVLQAYALQQTIQELGADCDIVNYQKKNWMFNQHTITIKKKLHTLWPLGWLLLWMLLKINYHSYDSFRRRYLKIEPHKKLQKTGELAAIENRYDKWIAGSDQIWNFDNPKVDVSFLLDFVRQDSKKIAYAASFGKAGMTAEQEAAFRQWLPRFQWISCRERRGVELVHDLAGRTAAYVLDPSLLLNEAKWRKIAEVPKEKNYILVYLRIKSDLLAEAAEQLAKATGAQIIGIGSYAFCPTKSGKRLVYPGPEKWLGYMLNARYVLTNSFHGMAFSVNFNKQFFAASCEGEAVSTNSRIFDILERFNLQERLITKDTNLAAMPNIAYQKINEMLAEKRKESLSYLRSALELPAAEKES